MSFAVNDIVQKLDGTGAGYVAQQVGDHLQVVVFISGIKYAFMALESELQSAPADIAAQVQALYEQGSFVPSI